MAYIDRVDYDGAKYLVRDSDSLHTVGVVSRFSGTKVSVLGDSMSTYIGYAYPGYPGSGYPGRGVTSVEETWWMKVILATGAALEQNASVGGSTVTTVRSSYPDFYARCGALGSPDLILVELGANDSTEGVALGEYDYTTAYTSLSEATFRTAYIKGVKTLEANYPDAEIVLVITKMTDAYADSIKAIGRHLGHGYADVRGYATEDDLHPNLQGMRDIASRVMFAFDAETDESLSVEGMAADASATGAALAGKVDVSQGAANVGKALVIGADGNVTTGEAGIPEAVKTALLNLLEHVAYADGQGQSLYEALVAAFGEDFYDTWVWKLSDEQFEVGVNSAGYDDATHSIFIGNSASVAAIRRHIRVGKGRKPFTDSIGGEDTIYYPIPIPLRASRAKVTITPSIQFSANICKLSGDIWTRSLDTGWKPHQGVFNFDAGENQALIIGMRADANNSAFTNTTEPTEIVIEFAIEDYYDSWHWEMADGHTTVNQRGAGLDNTTHRLFITASNANIRRFVAVNRGNVPYYDAGSGSESAFYPIPVPPTAQKMTVNVTPSTIQGQACVMKREGEAYSSRKWMEWSDFPLVSTFTPGENLELMIQLRANSSNANFTTATEPTALTVDFE